MNSTERTAKATSSQPGGLPSLARSRKASGPASSCALALALVLVLAGVPAQGAVTHEFLPEASLKLSQPIPAEGPSKEPIPQPGPLRTITGLTVDSGELYVAEGRIGAQAGAYRLDRFDTASGGFISQFPQAPPLEYLHQGVAVSHATGEREVYVVGDEPVEHGRVAVFGPAGTLQAAWDGADTPSEAFGCFECGGVFGDVAVDGSPGLSWAAGDVYVADPERRVVDVFKPGAGGKEEYITRLEGPKPPEALFTRPMQVAVSAFNGDVMIVDGSGRLDVFRPSAIPGQYEFVTALTGTPVGMFQNLTAIAVDGLNGDIYVAEAFTRSEPASAGAVYQFNAAGEYLGRLTGTAAGHFGWVESVAVDAGQHVYVGEFNFERGVGSIDVFGGDRVIPDVAVSEPVASLTPTGVVLRGTVNPDEAGAATCEFEYGTGLSYGQRAKCTAPVANGKTRVAIDSTPVSGLQPDTVYHYRLDASNTEGTNVGQGAEDLGEFTTPGAGVSDDSATNVASTSATLEATIDPNNATTAYYFQYGASTEYGSEAPLLSEAEPDGALLGSTKGYVQVSQHVQSGLAPGTNYHYRVVAVSEWAPGQLVSVYGPDHAFATQAVTSFALPDGRAWEMVSPPDKQGANIEIDYQGEKAIQAGAGGGAVTYVASAPTEAEPQGNTNLVMQVLSTRTPEGWRSRDIEPPHLETVGLVFSDAEEYRVFSNDLSLAAFQPFGGYNPSLSAESSEQTPYLRSSYTGGSGNALCVESCYRPLVVGCPTVAETCAPTVAEHADVPAGTVFGTKGQCRTGGRGHECGPRFMGATPDLSHVVLSSPVALTGGTPVPPPALYEWTAGSLQLISVLPQGEGGEAVSGTLGNPDARARQRGVISDDGARVFWTLTSSGTAPLYMRDTLRGATVRLDAVQGGSGEGPAAPKFQAASSDGSKVLFTDQQRLTPGSGASNGQADLYQCKISESAGQPACKLSDLTPAGGLESAGVQGAVLGASEDGSWVYFVASGVLAGNPSASAEVASAKAANLYVIHQGETRFVAVLSPKDGSDWNEEAFRHPTRVSPSGRWLAFMSQRPLTGYDTRDAVTGRPDEEVYLYDGESGRLVCASCNPTGARPMGVGAPPKGFPSLTLGTDEVWAEGTGIAANVPGWTLPSYQSRYLSDSGRLFFDAFDALVPQDVNGTSDVYEYESPGVGGCSTSAVTFSERSGGCVGLISSGASVEESAFLDASESGGDVFIVTAGKLVSQDFDTSLDVYDAHECTVRAPCLPLPAAQPPPCSTEASCRQAPSPPPGVFGAPASETFSGVGNLTPPATVTPTPRSRPLTSAQQLANALSSCRGKYRRSKKRRAACERQARKQHGKQARSSVKRRRGR